MESKLGFMILCTELDDVQNTHDVLLSFVIIR